MRHDTGVRVGSGGMGEVFKAWDPDLERFVALKYLRHDSGLSYALAPCGRTDEAEVLNREVLETFRRWGEADTGEALFPVYVRGVILRRQSLAPGHWRIGSDLVSGVGRILIRTGRYEEAEPFLREGLENWATGLGSGHRSTAVARATLAACLFGLERASEAEPLLGQALDQLTATPPTSADDVENVGRVAEFLEAVGRADDAAAFRSLLVRPTAASPAP